jgi:dihydropteroate synthase
LIWQCRNYRFDLNHKPLVLGILNATPDSFSDGYPTVEAGIEQAKSLIDQGADILDIGGESTRPGSNSVALTEELDRVIPLIEAIQAKHPKMPLSIDTNKPEVARHALNKGASIINHVDACNGWPGMVDLLKRYGAGYIAMHMRGTPKTMQKSIDYSDVLEEVGAELDLVRKGLNAAGVHDDQILFDPGIGFGKTLQHNLKLMAGAGRLAERLGRPLLMGISRKSWMTHLLEIPVDELEARDSLTASASALLSKPGVVAHRVHQVAWTKQALALSDTLRNNRQSF